MIRADQLQEIAAALSPPILSAYLNTGAQNASRHPQAQPDLTWLKKEAVSRTKSLLPRDVEGFERQVERVKQFLDQRHPNERALAIFASHETWAVLPIQVSVEDELRWGKPDVWQLFRLLSEHPPGCIVVVDHHAARFFMYGLGELNLLEDKAFDVDISQWKKKDLGHFSAESIRKTRGSQRDVFDDRLEAQFTRLCQETAQRAMVLCKKHDVSSLFLVGSERLITPIQTKIPHPFAKSVFLVPEDLGNLSPRELLRRLEPIIDDCEHKQQVAAVTELLGAERGAVLNVDETLARLENGAIRKIILARDLELELHQCVKCGRANRSADPICASCGAQRRKVALCGILPVLLAAHDTKLAVVTGEAARMLARAGGMGGWLRQARQTAAG